MQNQGTPTEQKIIASVNKSAQLLNQKKYYQFAQKIKSLSQRKTPVQAELMLHLSIQMMFKLQQTELNVVNQLIDLLLNLYEKNRILWNEKTSGKLYNLLNKKENPKKIAYYHKIIKSLCQIEHCPQIAEDLISYYEAKQQFVFAESYVAHLDLSRSEIFFNKWRKHLEEDQYFAIVARMTLLKGLIKNDNFDQAVVLLAQVPANSPFIKFAKFLIQSVQMNSRQSYQKIGSSYIDFLQKDPFFNQIYEFYGAKYFKKASKEKSGLMGLFA